MDGCRLPRTVSLRTRLHRPPLGLGLRKEFEAAQVGFACTEFGNFVHLEPRVGFGPKEIGQARLREARLEFLVVEAEA